MTTYGAEAMFDGLGHNNGPSILKNYVIGGYKPVETAMVGP